MLKAFKVLTGVIIAISAVGVSAQWLTNTTSKVIYCADTNKVVIGSESKSQGAKLNVYKATSGNYNHFAAFYNYYGRLSFVQPSGGAEFSIYASDSIWKSAKTLHLCAGGAQDTTRKAWIRLKDNGGAEFMAKKNMKLVGDTLTLTGASNLVMQTNATSSVVIGGTNPTVNGVKYKLAVKGKVAAQEIVVTTTGWADHVFKSDYNLKPLAEVEKHIKANGHLEGIPTEKEAIANGVAVGDMQVKLLAKVEELTLYMIDLKNENDKLKNEITQIKSKL